MPRRDIPLSLDGGKYDENKTNSLVVSNNLELIAYIIGGLRKSCNLFYADSGTDAIEKFEQSPKPEIIIAGSRMSPIIGREFLACVRELKGNKAVAFIFLIGADRGDESLKAAKDGALTYVEKRRSYSNSLKRRLKTL